MYVCEWVRRNDKSKGRDSHAKMRSELATAAAAAVASFPNSHSYNFTEDGVYFIRRFLLRWLYYILCACVYLCVWTKHATATRL